VFGSVDIQNPLVAVAVSAEAKLTDPEFRVGSASQRVEIVVGLTPLIVHDLVEFVGMSSRACLSRSS
jgi:hypothetical protein